MMNRSTHLRTLNGVFLIVQDCFADTETAQLADVVLPSAMWGEKMGCMTNAERRCTLLRKAVDPPGEARADLDIFLDFATRMNLRDATGRPLFHTPIRKVPSTSGGRSRRMHSGLFRHDISKACRAWRDPVAMQRRPS